MWLPWRDQRFRQAATAVLLVVACCSAAAQGPLWTHSPALAIVNVVTSLTFVFTGLTLYRQPGQRGVAWALILAGVCRSLDFADSWNAGPWPVYDIVCGGMDRVFGAWALLRYPNPRLLRYQRVFLILLASWMLIGRTLMAVTSTARWNGESPAAWWPSLMVNQRLFGLISVVVTAGEGLLGLAILVFLVTRLAQTRGLDRVVITPIIVAGLAAVVAASATAVVQMLATPGATPNGAFLTEGVVDLAVPPYPPPANVVICTETGEHLPDAAADGLVEACVSATPRTIVWRAAPPGQEWEGHINLQPAEYWLAKFGRLRYAPNMAATGALRARMLETEAQHVHCRANFSVLERDGA